MHETDQQSVFMLIWKTGASHSLRAVRGPVHEALAGIRTASEALIRGSTGRFNYAGEGVEGLSCCNCCMVFVRGGR